VTGEDAGGGEAADAGADQNDVAEGAASHRGCSWLRLGLVDESSM
jgi:hypothetical protein